MGIWNFIKAFFTLHNRCFLWVREFDWYQTEREKERKEEGKKEKGRRSNSVNLPLKKGVKCSNFEITGSFYYKKIRRENVIYWLNVRGKIVYFPLKFWYKIWDDQALSYYNTTLWLK